MNWQSIVKAVAPWIGTALGGPLGGLAITAAAEALGLSEKTTEALSTALGGATGEQLQALRAADQAFQIQMQALGFKHITDLESIAAADRADARSMQVANKSFVPALLTAGIIGAFVCTLAVLMVVGVPESNRDIVVYMIGQLSGFTASAVAFWLGTTRQSEIKTGLLAQPVKE